MLVLITPMLSGIWEGLLRRWLFAGLLALLDGVDLLPLVKGMLDKRGPGLRRVPKVRKGHDDEEMVNSGQFRALDKIGDDQAGHSADYCGRRVTEGVIDARRLLSGVCSLWYLVVSDMRRFFIAIARIAVDDEFGIVPSIQAFLTWSSPTLLARCFKVFLSCVLCIDLLRPVILVWVGWVTYLELLFVYDLWSEERCGPLVPSAWAFVGPGMVIWKSCRFMGYVLRALGNCLVLAL